MKSICAVLLSLVILLPSLSKGLIVAGYALNKNYIAQFLCENRSNPGSECHGKCHLSKQLKAVDDHENNVPSLVNNKAEIVYFFQEFLSFSFPVYKPSQPVFPLEKPGTVRSIATGVFHPPKIQV